MMMSQMNQNNYIPEKSMTLRNSDGLGGIFYNYRPFYEPSKWWTEEYVSKFETHGEKL